MLRREFMKTATITAALAACGDVGDESQPASRHTKLIPPGSNGTVADVNGQHIYYSVHGAGKPLILLHGGIDPDSFGQNRDTLAKGRQVIAVHLQGHGRTPDSSRPLRPETLSDDLAALIGYLKLGKADVMGYSLGAGVALQTAIRHAEAVDRLVLVSGALAKDGFYPEGVAAFDQLESHASEYGRAVKDSPLGQSYPDVDWTNLFSKTGAMTKRSYDWRADVVRLRARTLLVFADADAMRPEHIVEFWKALGGGHQDAGLDGSRRPANQLAILPNATHYTLAVDPRLPDIVEEFLATT